MNKLEEIVKILNELNIKNIKIYDLENSSPFFDYLIISTSTNERTSQAVINHIKKSNIEVRHIDDNSLEWLLIDFNDIILNVFTEEMRKFYRLDDLFIDKKQIDLVK